MAWLDKTTHRGYQIAEVRDSCNAIIMAMVTTPGGAVLDCDSIEDGVAVIETLLGPELDCEVDLPHTFEMEART